MDNKKGCLSDYSGWVCGKDAAWEERVVCILDIEDFSWVNGTRYSESHMRVMPCPHRLHPILATRTEPLPHREDLEVKMSSRGDHSHVVPSAETCSDLPRPINIGLAASRYGASATRDTASKSEHTKRLFKCGILY
jgi:hypothetical protein